MSGEFAGMLRERIHVEQQLAERNPMGLQHFGWSRLFTCRASVVAESIGPEREAMALSAMPRFRVTIRRRDGVAIDQRVEWKGRLLMIRQIVDDPSAADRLTLRCEEVRR